MNRLLLNQVSKRFNTHWVFRKLSLDIGLGESLYIDGPNGSGKSTLLKIISGWLSPNEGSVEYYKKEQKVDVDNVFHSVSICAPYFDVIEEFNLDELLSFHQSFKPLERHTKPSDFAQAIEIEYSKNKAIKSYSSGMKQRVKLGLALFSNSDLLLLDEPTANLDKQGIAWYRTHIEKVLQGKIVIVCSNKIDDEHFFCTKKITITDFK